MKYYKVTDIIDGDEILYRVNGKNIEMYHNGKWVESHTGMNYIKNYCTPISEKEAFIEALSSPYDYNDSWDTIWGKWTLQYTMDAADKLRNEIDREIIQSIIDKVDKENLL